MEKELQIGDKAPAFNLLNQYGERVSNNNYKDKWLVLYFYPKDNTPGCTREAMEFSSLMKEFRSLNIGVMGINADNIESHCKFTEKKCLSVILLSDPDKKIIKAYNSLSKKKLFSKEIEIVSRNTFLIDQEGKIRHIWKKVNVIGHAREVLEKSKELIKK